MLGSLIKYVTVNHFTQLNFIIHIFGQSLLLVIFLGVVFGMTFKKNLYGNLSTKNEYDTGKWEYGQNICIVIVTLALVIEFLVFTVSLGQMICALINMLISALVGPKNPVQ